MDFAGVFMDFIEKCFERNRGSEFDWNLRRKIICGLFLCVSFSQNLFVQSHIFLDYLKFTQIVQVVIKYISNTKEFRELFN